jgi:MFS family permease
VHSTIDSNDPAFPSAREAWGCVAVLLITYTVSYADRTVMSLLIDPIKHAFQINDTQVSLLVGLAFATFYVVIGLPAGYVADRVSRRNLIILGILGWSLMTAACGLAGSFAILFVARMGVGIGESTLTPSAYSLLSDFFPRDKLGRAASAYAIGVPLGSGLALILGGLLVRAIGANPIVQVPILGSMSSWRPVFLIQALFGIPVALLLFTIREPVRRGVLKERVSLRDTLKFLRTRRALLSWLLPAGGVFSLALNGMLAWAPTFLIRTYGLERSEAGFYYGLVLAIGGLAGLLLGGFGSDYLFRRGYTDAHLRCIMMVSFIAIPFMIAFPLAPTLGVSLLTLFPATVFMTVPIGISFTAIQLFTPSAFRGQMTAIYLLVVNLTGLGLGPTVVAALTDYVFKDPLALRYSLVVTAAAMLPCAGILYALCLKYYRGCIENQGTVQYAR